MPEHDRTPISRRHPLLAPFPLTVSAVALLLVGIGVALGIADHGTVAGTAAAAGHALSARPA